MNPDPRSQAGIQIEHIEGDTFIVVHNHGPEAAPDIPDGQGRLCPQCARDTWRRSRWCMHCQYDFERCALPRLHPSKLLALSLIANLCLCMLLAYVLYTAHNC